jgi:hypothetical protein
MKLRGVEGAAILTKAGRLATGNFLPVEIRDLVALHQETLKDFGCSPPQA